MAITGMKQNKIGIFDSGIGGINVLKELITNKPNNDYLYFGDSIHLPYGNKTKEELLSYSINVIEYLISQGVTTIIFACGTLCATVLETCKNMYPNIEFISIIEPTINYLNNSKYQNIGLIATENTINSNVFTQNIHKNIISISTPEFVTIIEKRLLDKFDYYIDYYLHDIPKIDCLILGCTHYPVLSKNLSKYLNVPIIDMGKILSNEIPEHGNQNVTIYFSYIDEKTKENVNNIIGDYKIIRKEL